jgi:hypothetical protein
MTTRRPLVVALVTLCGLAITAGAALPWIKARGTRPASGITHTSLFALRHLTYTYSTTTKSYAIAVAAVGILLVVGGLIASRVVAGALSVIALAAAALWIWLNARHYNSSHLPYKDLRAGAWLTIAGGLVAVIAIWWLRRKDDLADTSPWQSSVAALADDREYDYE